jgi:hypothetical protein
MSGLQCLSCANGNPAIILPVHRDRNKGIRFMVLDVYDP